MRYSFLSLAREALGGHRGWPRAWRDAAPKPAYDVVIVGGGGHGLATAHYLAADHGITNVAVLERGWLAGGNVARNTTIIRSNYLWDDSAHLYEHALKLWEGLSQELNYNVMFSPRGVVSLAQEPGELREMRRRVAALRLNGIDSEMLSVAALKVMIPILDVSSERRYTVLGGMVQKRGGIARHDAVAWGFARSADRRGIDIIENCEVIALRREGGRVTGVETSRGTITAKKVAVSAAGHTSCVMASAGLRLPLVTYPIHAYVSEPLKPVLDTVVMALHSHISLSQSDKGELVFGGAREDFASYHQGSATRIVEEQLAALIDLFPAISRLRILRQWAGIVDCTPDASPIVGLTPLDGLYLNCGWGTGGFKATPGAGSIFAHTIATGAPHPLAIPFGLARFESGRLLDETAASGAASH